MYEGNARGPKTFQQAVQSGLAEHNLRKRFDLRSNVKHDQEELMEVDHIEPRKKCFKCGKYGHIAKHCKSVNVIGRSAEQSQNHGEVHYWKCRNDWVISRGISQRIENSKVKTRKTSMLKLY